MPWVGEPEFGRSEGVPEPCWANRELQKGQCRTIVAHTANICRNGRDMRLCGTDPLSNSFDRA
jgi:hypothetical protein